MGYILSSNLGISRGTGQHKADLSPEDYEAATRVCLLERLLDMMYDANKGSSAGGFVTYFSA